MTKTNSQKDLEKHWAKQLKDSRKSPEEKKQTPAQRKDRNQLARERKKVPQEPAG